MMVRRLLALVVLCARGAACDTAPGDETGRRLYELEAQTTQLYRFIAEHKETIAAQQATIADPTARLAAAEEMTSLADLVPYVSVDGDNVIIEGANLVVRNAEGSSDSADGTGNLIIGYAEDRAGDTPTRTGSHNLVIGPGHAWASYGGIVGGNCPCFRSDQPLVGGGAPDGQKLERAVSGREGWGAMTHEVRFNIEAALFKLADGLFKTVRDETKKAQDATVEGFRKEGDDQRADVFETFGAIAWGGDALAIACVAVIAWAAAYEAFVNFVWMLEAEPHLSPMKKLSTRLLRTLSTLEKTDCLLELKGRSLKDESWNGPLNELIGARNRLLHYKEKGEFLGIPQPSSLSTLLSMDALGKWRAAAVDAVRCLADLFPNEKLETGFVDGDYQIESQWS